jgi:phage shock protein PspC (stress-responsive transcriptional regulator)
MHSNRGNLFTRDDTFFGVCEGLGEDLGISGNWLRLAFTGLLFWNLPIALAAYAAAGTLVLVTRLLVPNPRLRAVAPSAVEDATPAEQQPVAAAQDVDPAPVPLAA